MATPASILVVDDEENVRLCIRRLLETAGFHTVAARDGYEALDVFDSQPVDLILADIAMPRMNGYQLHERIVGNPQRVATPFIFVTARAMDSDVRYGKELGVDDYVTKPFRHEDLMAAVRGRLRRARQLAAVQGGPASGPAERPDVVELGQLRMDLRHHLVWMGDEQISLSAREFKLLEALARQENRVVPFQELVQATHGLDTDRTDASSLLRPLVRSLRRKLGYDAGHRGCIENVRGVGYQLAPPSAEEIRAPTGLPEARHARRPAL
jgi:DNA-binding response OmpR family regulator